MHRLFYSRDALCLSLSLSFYLFLSCTGPVLGSGGLFLNLFISLVAVEHILRGRGGWGGGNIITITHVGAHCAPLPSPSPIQQAYLPQQLWQPRACGIVIQRRLCLFSSGKASLKQFPWPVPPVQPTPERLPPLPPAWLSLLPYSYNYASHVASLVLISHSQRL